VAEVVDVLAGAGEVHELQGRAQLGVVAQALLDEVLERLDVVVGGALDLLDPGGVGHRKALGQGPQAAGGGVGEGLEFGNARLSGQGQQQFHLDPDPGPDQAELGKDRPQGLGLGGVTPVQRRQGGQGELGHRAGSRALRGRRFYTGAARRPALCWSGTGTRRRLRWPPGPLPGPAPNATAWVNCRYPPKRSGAPRPNARCRTSRSPACACRGSSSAPSAWSRPPPPRPMPRWGTCRRRWPRPSARRRCRWPPATSTASSRWTCSRPAPAPPAT